MKKRFITFLSMAIVVLSFITVVDGTRMFASAEEESKSSTSATTSTTKRNNEQEFTTTTTTTTTKKDTTASTDSTTASTTESTTGSGIKDPSTTRPTIIDWGNLTTKPKDEPDKSEPASEKPDVSEEASESEKSSESDSKPSTTKKKPTTKPYKPKPTTPKVTIPTVPNTEIEGTTLSPLDAYFERITEEGAGSTYIFGETTTELVEQEDETELSMGAIIALCIGGIALLTVILTGLFVLRNKKAAEDGEDEYDEEYDDEYETDEPLDDETAASTAENTGVDQTGSFKIVNFNDEDF